jgi:hypothetical protein
LATTPALFAGVQDRSEPFFGFFNPIPLSPLSRSIAMKKQLALSQTNIILGMVKELPYFQSVTIQPH